MVNPKQLPQEIALLQSNITEEASSRSITIPYAPGELSRITTQDEKKCRICLISDIESDDEALENDPLIRPCLCKGSMAYVHLQCLQRWRQESSKNEFTCEVCHYHYSLYRPFWAKIVGSRYLTVFITIVLVIIIIAALSYLVKVIDVFLFHHYPNPQDATWLKWHGTTVILWLDRFYVFVGVCLTAFLGLVYLFVALAIGSRHNSFTGFPCRGDYMGAGAIDTGPLVLIVLVLFGIVVAAGGVFQLVHNLLSKLMTHAQERILEVTDA
ncbi:hypothetical protein BGW37DRAFT_506227 [Umbelopsis sp. PMI_123]|nr:hypothetical protein BGW37DRAFT_506227 [Umbelopsis sp. PMI_123]